MNFTQKLTVFFLAIAIFFNCMTVAINRATGHIIDGEPADAIDNAAVAFGDFFFGDPE